MQTIPEKPILKAKLIGQTTTPTIPNIPISQEGIHYFTLEKKGSEVPPILVCEVKWRNGLKFVTFRSTYVVKNATAYDSEMQVIKAADGKYQVMHTSKIRETICLFFLPTLFNLFFFSSFFCRIVVAGDDFCVPLHLAMDCSLQFRPFGSFLLLFIDFNDHLLICRCHPRHPEVHRQV